MVVGTLRQGGVRNQLQTGTSGGENGIQSVSLQTIPPDPLGRGVPTIVQYTVRSNLLLMINSFCYG